MPKLNHVVQFVLLLILTLSLVFLIHIYVLDNAELPVFGSKIVLSYITNVGLALIIYLSLYKYRFRLKDYIGFLFMAGSFLKFIFFFTIFYPSYKLDGDMSRIEFAAFFVPYVICLFFETVYMAKMLRKLD
ncbi:hypothetical protein JQC67_03945 [Aurantibacter crassamenti]|uniref:DUF6168 family protein n=1 Tax=Aurantibacter crassamenti TaxID=1837375 RepID=UPI00193AC84B|nr:DUF6168 family protein [Aurantibacter crassamenti]MBM1105286.1 hypothetical protein [Aurantibacter crassamenti]